MIATDKGREKKFEVWTTFVLVQVQHPKPLKPRKCMYKINLPMMGLMVTQDSERKRRYSFINSLKMSM
jgi:hypothetical protein